MDFGIKVGLPEKQRGACVVVGVFESRKLTGPAKTLDKATEGYISSIEGDATIFQFIIPLMESNHNIYRNCQGD